MHSERLYRYHGKVAIPPIARGDGRCSSAPLRPRLGSNARQQIVRFAGTSSDGDRRVTDSRCALSTAHTDRISGPSESRTRHARPTQIRTRVTQASKPEFSRRITVSPTPFDVRTPCVLATLIFVCSTETGLPGCVPSRLQVGWCAAPCASCAPRGTGGRSCVLHASFRASCAQNASCSYDE